MGLEWVSITTAFLLGFGHGFDPDHIAAIADFIGMYDNKKNSFTSAFFYIVGHALVVIVIMLIFIFVLNTFKLTGKEIEGGSPLGPVPQFLVGLTLFALGITMGYNVLRRTPSKRLMSWKMILLDKLHIMPSSPVLLGFVVGIIHGIGAETATQVSLFTMAGIQASISQAIVVSLVFVLGLFIANSILVFTGLGLLEIARKFQKVFAIFYLMFAIFSVLLGINYMLFLDYI